MQITIARQDFEILTPISHIQRFTRLIELAGRTCYKSEDRISEASAERFVRMLVKAGHHSVLEHCSITVKITGDRALTHQLIRHRIAAYSQESQRYCDYSKRGLEVILPPSIGVLEPGAYVQRCDSWFTQATLEQELEVDADAKLLNWLDAVAACYKVYLELRESKVRPEDARSILPNATKTEVVATYNLRQWRHIFQARALNRQAQSQIRDLLLRVLVRFAELLPAVFGDLMEDDGARVSQPLFGQTTYGDRALIVSDSPSRRQFLMRRFEQTGMVPVEFSESSIYVFDIEDRKPQVLAVDLTMPIAKKLELVGNTLSRYPDIKVITIGMKDYLIQERILEGRPNVVMCDSVDEI